MSMRLGKKWNRLMNIEKLEDRWNPDATFGWEADASGLWFRIDGDQSGPVNAIADTVSIMNDSHTGTIQVTINTLSSDDLTPLDYFLSISGGEIALAQSALGKAFKGFRVNTYEGNDTVGAGTLPWSLQVNAGDGNDNVTGGLLADTIDGGAGNDTVNSGSGSDSVVGGAGNDVINSGTGNDTVDAGTGNDSVLGGAGNDSIVAGDGNDTVDSGTGNDTVTGGTGNDSIVAGDGNDSVDAGDGNDTVTGGTGNDSIAGGTGNDNIDAGDGNDTVDGGTGNDAITGGNGADSLLGGDGNDTVNADTSDIFFNGGSGTDTFNLSGTGTLGPIIDSQTNGFEIYNLNPAANVTFAPSTADFLAVPQPNFSGIGLNAGDTLSFQNAPSGQTIDLNSLPFGLGSSGITSVIGSPFNDFITGTAGNDSIDGAAGDDVLFGGAGNDTMQGGAGNDAVFGEAGDDSMFGGTGNDTVVGGLGNDFLGIEWAGGALNAADQFLGLDGVDTLVFQGVPDADGNPNNGIQPSAANLVTIFNYIAAQNAADKMDYGSGDNNTIVYI